MALGKATGWIKWGGERFDFEGAPSYAEKNWGGGFPDKWFWMQCDSFEGGGMSAITCTGETGIARGPCADSNQPAPIIPACTKSGS